jgi:hypothetical protein
MRRRTTGFLAIAIAIAALAPSTASAAGYKCKKTATVESGELLRFTNFAEPGVPVTGDTITRGGAFFEAASKVVLDFAGNTYTIAEGTIFMQSCYGRSVQTGMTLPGIDMLKGEIKVKTGAKTPGAIITTEGFYDPRTDYTMTFEATRTLHKNNAAPTPEQIRSWYAGFISAPLGATRVSTDGKPIVGVTPYVGSKRGTCRYVHGATLISKGTTRKGYFTGTATYRS